MERESSLSSPQEDPALELCTCRDSGQHARWLATQSALTGLRGKGLGGCLSFARRSPLQPTPPQHPVLQSALSLPCTLRPIMNLASFCLTAVEFPMHEGLVFAPTCPLRARPVVGGMRTAFSGKSLQAEPLCQRTAHGHGPCLGHIGKNPQKMRSRYGKENIGNKFSSWKPRCCPLLSLKPGSWSQIKPQLQVLESVSPREQTPSLCVSMVCVHTCGTGSWDTRGAAPCPPSAPKDPPAVCPPSLLFRSHNAGPAAPLRLGRPWKAPSPAQPERCQGTRVSLPAELDACLPSWVAAAREAHRICDLPWELKHRDAWLRWGVGGVHVNNQMLGVERWPHKRS